LIPTASQAARPGDDLDHLDHHVLAERTGRSAGPPGPFTPAPPDRMIADAHAD
jgi:hypothetical protein